MNSFIGLTIAQRGGTGARRRNSFFFCVPIERGDENPGEVYKVGRYMENLPRGAL
jgi:hypothetical protein